MLNENDIQDAIQKIKDDVAARLGEFVSKDVSELSRNAQMHAEEVLRAGVQAKNTMDSLAGDLRTLQAQLRDISESRPDEPTGGEKVISKIGGLIGDMGRAVVGDSRGPGAVNAILDSSVKIAGQAVRTACSLGGTVAKATANVADGMLSNGANVAKGMVDTASSTVNSLMGQTANITSSLSSAVSKTMDAVFGSGNKAQAQQKTSSILQNSISSMIENSTSQLCQNPLVQNAVGMANGLLNGISTSASNLKTSGQTSADSIVKGALSLASDWVGSGPAGALVDKISKGISPSGSTGFEGLFKDAAQGAASLINAGKSGVGAASELVGKLASGVSQLGGSLLGTASSAASSIMGNAASAVADIGGAVNGLLNGTTDAQGGQQQPGLIDSAGNVAKSLLSGSANIGKGLFDAIGDVGKSLANGSFAGDVGSAVGGLAKFAGNAVSGAADLASSVVQTAAKVAGGVMDAASGMVKNAMDAVGGLFNGLAGDAEKAQENIQKDAQQASQEIQDECDEMMEEFDEDGIDFDWGEDEDYESEEVDLDKEIQDFLSELDGYIDDEDTDDEEDEDGDQGQQGSNQSSKEDDSSTTTPIGPPATQTDNGMTPKGNVNPTFGWKGLPEGGVEIPTGLEMMMHDGDQQFLNPYGQEMGAWTMYSFRPCDRDDGWPVISITPASFESLSSIDEMLNNIPFVVVKEYFFKNTASMMIDFVKKIMGAVKETSDAVSNEDDKSSQGSGGAKNVGESLISKIMEKFETGLTLEKAAIDIPYILYYCLRKKVFGNTYIFPYIVKSDSTVINQASNQSEWDPSSGGNSIIDKIKGAVSNIASTVASFALSATGSQGRITDKVFPAPTWNNDKSQPSEFSFDLYLINDNLVKTRNNYMCVNTIIHNNRSIQKAIMNFPGALYEIWLPTGQRHLMCTGDFTLYPVGLNRKVPTGFFESFGSDSGANFSIGTSRPDAATIKNPHTDSEVIPDAYHLGVKFKSCIANNMNNSVFQYYVKMTGYDNFAESQMGGDENEDAATDKLVNMIKAQPAKDEPAPATGDASAHPSEQKSRQEDDESRSLRLLYARAVEDLSYRETASDSYEEDDSKEKFEESTYNKKLERIKGYLGDQAMNADSVVATIRGAQRSISEATKFLSRLYSSPDSSLWWRTRNDEEIYTTLKPDYRQTLKRRYASTFGKMRNVVSEIKNTQTLLDEVSRGLSEVLNLQRRNPMIERKVQLTRTLNSLLQQKDQIADELVQIDVDLIQRAFDEQDSVVSVKRSEFTASALSQMWGEKIMNSYEREKIQYLTSDEKERYFQDKIRGMKKMDTHGVLNHSEWFFRVAVLDYIVEQMKQLVDLFKNCSYDDFDTIYKIVRKLKLLQLDLQCVYSSDEFNINRTNLFQVSDEEMKKFNKIDRILEGSTLYELFQSQIVLNFSREESSSSSSASIPSEEESRTLLQEQSSEIQADKQRKTREDIVVRVWGSESNLTKAAYELVKSSQNEPLENPVEGYANIRTIGQLKNEIIALKISGDDEEKLKKLLGAMTNHIGVVKEALVMQEMSRMSGEAAMAVKTKDDDINAPLN